MAMSATEHSTLAELLEKRNDARDKCRDIMNKAETDKDKNPILSAEQRQEFDRWETEARQAKEEYDIRLKDNNRKSWLDADEDPDVPAHGRQTERNEGGKGKGPRTIKWNPSNQKHSERRVILDGTRAAPEYNSAFTNFLNGHGPEAFNKFKPADYKDMNAGTPMQSDVEEKGGYFIASEEFVGGVLKEVDDVTFVQRLGRLFVVRNARSLGVRRRTRKVNSFEWSQELTDLTSRLDESLAYGKRQLTPHYIGGGIPISRDLIRSTMIPVETMVLEELGIDLGEKLEDAYLYGDGNEKPLGVMTPSVEGVSTGRDVAAIDADVNTTGGEDGTTHFGFNTLIRAKYNQKLRYRNRSRWMFHRDTMARISMIRDLNGQYIWQPSKIVGDPDTILGLPADESEWMPNTFTTGLYFGLLADWSYYWIAYALEMEIMRLTELRALTNEVLYIARAKVDAMPMLEEAFTRLKFAAA